MKRLMPDRRSRLCADCGKSKKTKLFRDGYGVRPALRCDACISKLPSVIEARQAMREALLEKETPTSTAEDSESRET
jgi:hypothetical protein